MALKSRMNLNAIDRELEKATQKMQKDIIRVLRFVGEKAVNEARLNKTYQDRTANLRNSTGYVIVFNGRVVHQDFSSSASGSVSSNEDGKRIGREFALELANNYPDIALIVVAGMKYAAYVESMGYNVLTSAEQLAKVQVPLLLNQLM